MYFSHNTDASWNELDFGKIVAFHWNDEEQLDVAWKSKTFHNKPRCNNVNIYLYRARYGISLMLYIDAINMF